MVPRSISRVTDNAVKISMVMVRMVPTRPGTMLSREDAADCSARGCGFRTASTADRRPADRAPERCTIALSEPSAVPAATDRSRRQRPN